MQSYSSANHFKMIKSQPSILGVIMAEIKTDKNASGASYQDSTDGISSVTSKVCDVANSQRPISVPIDDLIVTIQTMAFQHSR